MNHVELVKRAIEFQKPDYLPMELVDVPGIYNAYGTLDQEKVEFVPGTKDFDSAWVTYHWTFRPAGQTEQGEVLRKDEWGCLQKVPSDENSAYAVLEKPLAGKNNLAGYKFPNPGVTDDFFGRTGEIIKTRYPDRFICGYIDPGAFLITYNLLGYQDFFLKLAEDVKFAVELVGRIFEYQKALIPRWKKMGSHLVNIIDEFAGSSGLFFNPELWRKYFRSFSRDLFRTIHQHNMYTGYLLDGDIRVILDDLLAMEIDVFQFMQPNAIGMNTLVERIRGKRCVKCSVDMMTTLALGTPEEVRKEARELVEKLNSPAGGFIPIVLRWHRPEYPADNVLASVETFNRYRK